MMAHLSQLRERRRFVEKMKCSDMKSRISMDLMLGICCALQSIYDNQLGLEFQSEIQTLARVEHLNLVRFLGFLEYGDERIVVVEYVPNGTLREHLDCEFLTVVKVISLLRASLKKMKLLLMFSVLFSQL